MVGPETSIYGFVPGLLVTLMRDGVGLLLAGGAGVHEPEPDPSPPEATPVAEAAEVADGANEFVSRGRTSTGLVPASMGAPRETSDVDRRDPAHRPLRPPTRPPTIKALTATISHE